MARDLLVSQCTFFAFLALCIVLMPGILFRRNEGGMSNYGIHTVTVIPYSGFYKRSGDLHATHVAVAVIILLFETAASAWLIAAILHGGWDVVILGCEIVGLLLAASTVVGWLHVLFVAQLITSAAFAVLLVRGGRRLDASEVGVQAAL